MTLRAKTQLPPTNETPKALGVTAQKQLDKTERPSVLAPRWEETGYHFPARPQPLLRKAPMVGLRLEWALDTDHSEAALR